MQRSKVQKYFKKVIKHSSTSVVIFFLVTIFLFYVSSRLMYQFIVTNLHERTKPIAYVIKKDTDEEVKNNDLKQVLQKYIVNEISEGVVMDILPPYLFKKINNILGSVVLILGVGYVIIKKKKLNKECIKYITYYDKLTGLTNRAYLKEQFNKQKDNYQIIACIYLDVDNFKVLNDSFGYKYGDYVLVEIGKRINDIASEESIVSRIGADEFGILLMGIEAREDVKYFVQNIEESFKETFTINRIKFGISFSIGISMYPRDGGTFDELLNSADTAMHRAKDKGKRTHVFFNHRFKELTLEKIYMESDLRKAILNSEFILYYQPQLEVATGKVKGCEALIRWIKKDGSITLPIKFIDIAEEIGLMIPIGLWVIKEACCFINRLKDKGYDDVYVSVNISVVQLIQDDFVEKIEEILKETKIDVTKLHVEITETILMRSLDVSIQKLEKIQKKGVVISLDDFGKGYSSLAYLKQLPIDVLKIEKAFIDDIIKNSSKNITGAIINLAHELGFAVIAEGVEEECQLEYLKAYHCDMIQGYLFSRPIPELEVIKFIEKNLGK